MIILMKEKILVGKHGEPMKREDKGRDKKKKECTARKNRET